MKPFFTRLAKFIGFLIIALFITASIWENGEKPSPGESVNLRDGIFKSPTFSESAEHARCKHTFHPYTEI